MDNDKYIKLAKKLQALVDRGVGGESTNAKLMLDKLMKKYHISLDDLCRDTLSIYDIWYDIKIPYNKNLLHQVIYSVIGSIDKNKGFCIYTYFNKGRSRWHKVGIRCTTSDYIEIMAKYKFYLHYYVKEFEDFYQSFILTNQIYPPEELVDPDDGIGNDYNQNAINMSMMMTNHKFNTKKLKENPVKLITD